MFAYWCYSMRIIVGFSGASGFIYGWRLVKALKSFGHSVWAVVSRGGLHVGRFECGENVFDELKNVVDGFCLADDWDCPLSSGSFPFDAVVVAPCSLRTLAAIANSLAYNVLVRSAVNALRMGRKLVLVVRETPWSRIDFENAARIASAGGIVMPASPAFYHNPRGVMDLVDYVVGRVLDVLGIEHKLYSRWEEARTQGPLNLCAQDV